MKSIQSQYAHYIRHFKWARKQAYELVSPLEEKLFNKRPSAESWCVGECFSHLVETGGLYLNKAEEGMANSGVKSNSEKNPMHLRFFIRWFVSYLEPPVSVKTKAPKAFQPDQYAISQKE